jgi:hypothetical protein
MLMPTCRLSRDVSPRHHLCVCAEVSIHRMLDYDRDMLSLYHRQHHHGHLYENDMSAPAREATDDSVRCAQRNPSSIQDFTALGSTERNG